MDWKKIFVGSIKSKTVWFNLLFGVVLVANAYGFQEFEPDESVLLLGNILLRLLTTKAISEK
jgi:hypothetical protein